MNVKYTRTYHATYNDEKITVQIRRYYVSYEMKWGFVSCM